MVKTGDYVVYKPKNEIGRVAEVKGNGCHVCYHTGCTSAFTDYEYLRKATADEIKKSDPDLGFNRFKETCDKYTNGICYEKCKEKFNGQNN